jgi:hypothetical protein
MPNSEIINGDYLGIGEVAGVAPVAGVPVAGDMEPVAGVPVAGALIAPAAFLDLGFVAALFLLPLHRA